jgi:hypothetical protein
LAVKVILLFPSPILPALVLEMELATTSIKVFLFRGALAAIGMLAREVLDRGVRINWIRFALVGCCKSGYIPSLGVSDLSIGSGRSVSEIRGRAGGVWIVTGGDAGVVRGSTKMLDATVTGGSISDDPRRGSGGAAVDPWQELLGLTGSSKIHELLLAMGLTGDYVETCQY